MHYVTHRYHWMRKHKFSVTCPVVLFVESEPVPPEHEKLCAEVSCPRLTRMTYVTSISHQRLKHKFSVTVPSALFVESEPVRLEHEK